MRVLGGAVTPFRAATADWTNMTSNHSIRLTTLSSVLFCALFMLSGAVQPQKRTIPLPTSDPNATKPQVLREYKQGELYALGDIVNLNADGNKLTVELV